MQTSLFALSLQGAATVKKFIPEAISIFIAAESQAKLVERLASRKTESIVGHMNSAYLRQCKEPYSVISSVVILLGSLLGWLSLAAIIIDCMLQCAVVILLHKLRNS
jgi:hypothetical protein